MGCSWFHLAVMEEGKVCQLSQEAHVLAPALAV